MWLGQLGFCLGLWLLFAGPVWAEAPPFIADLAVLADPAGSETIASISAPERSADFRLVPHGFSAGFTRQVHWLRFTLRAPPPGSDGERALLLEIHPPYLDSLQLYWPDVLAVDGFSVRYSGDLLPYTSRELPYRSFVHRLRFGSDQPVTVYLRLQTSSSSLVSLKAWEPERFIKATSREYMCLGIFFGMLLVSLLINLWSGLWRTQPLYRGYLLHLGTSSFMMLGMNGLPSELWFMDDPLWGHHWTSLGVLLVFASGAHFYRLALGMDDAPRWMGILHRCVQTLALLALPAPFLDFYPEVIRVLMPLVIAMLIIGALWLWRQQRSRFCPLLVAYMFAISGTLTTTLTLLGLLPGQFWLIYGYMLASVGTLLSLQWMLTRRIRWVEAERTAARIATERAQALAEHERAEREQQRRFLAMLTHELKTPLAVIRMQMGTPNASLSMQQHAERAVDEINSLVERCALVSRIEDRQLPLDRQSCRLAELLGELICREGVHERIELSLQPVPDLPSEPLLLRTVLGNLIDNGIKYAPASAKLRLSLAPHQKGGATGLLLRFCNPVGVAGHPDPERLFDKYYRAPGAHAHAGSGLGLYIVRELTTMLGGDVRYLPTASEVCFELWLPIAPLR